MGIKIKNMYNKVVSPENLYRSVHRTLLKGLRYKENGAGWKLRMLEQLRMAYHLKLINAGSLHYAACCLQEEGSKLGGWIKSEER